MKALLSLIIFSVLSVAGYAQTRNVLVGTNSVIVQPTNFWSADASNARTGLGLVLPALTNTSNSGFRSSIGLGSAATNATTDFQPPSAALSNLVSGNGGALTNIQSTSLIGIIPATNIGIINFSNVAGTLPITDGGTGATNAATARTNLGLGWSALTNTNSAGFVTSLYGAGNIPVLTDSSGNVISPTNFVWQNTNTGSTYTNVIQAFTNLVASSTNDITNARSVVVYSLNSSSTNITNTLQLPVAGVSSGDVATIVHLGPTNSLTAVRSLGSITNLITFNGSNDVIGFIYNGANWGIFPNESQLSPLKFTGPSASINSSQTRTNLGLGATWLTNTNTSNFRTAIGLTLPALTNISAADFRDSIGLTLTSLTATNSVDFRAQVLPPYASNADKFLRVKSDASDVEWVTDNAIITFPIAVINGGTGATNAAQARTNLGITLAAFTNTTTANFNNAIGLGTANTATFGAATIGGTTAMSNATVSGTLTVTGTSSLGPVSLASDLPITEGGTGASSASAARNNLGLGTAATQASSAFAQVANSLSDITNTGAARTNLGLGATWLTNTNVTNFRTDIGLGATNNVTFNSLTLFDTNSVISKDGWTFTGNSNTTAKVELGFLGGGIIDGIGFSMSRSSVTATVRLETNRFISTVPIEFQAGSGGTVAATTRTNLGLGGGITTNISVTGTNNTNTLYFSNGILTNVTAP